MCSSACFSASQNSWTRSSSPRSVFGELADLRVQGWLRDVQFFGRPREVEAVGEGDEGEQPVVIHRSAITLGDA